MHHELSIRGLMSLRPVNAAGGEGSDPVTSDPVTPRVDAVTGGLGGEPWAPVTLRGHPVTGSLRERS